MVGKQESACVPRHSSRPSRTLPLSWCSQVPLFLLAFHSSAFLTRHLLGDLECEATNSVPLSGPSGEKAVQ